MPVKDLVAKPCLKLLALAACFGLECGPAAAAVTSFSIPVTSVQTDTGATVNYFIQLPDAGTPAFAISFVLPRDYEENTEVSITFQLMSAAPACETRFRAVEMFRMRAGVQFAYGLNGLSSSGTTVPLAPGIMKQKNFALMPGALLAGQKAGDAFIIRFMRFADVAVDTCSGVVSVGGIEIRYQVAP